MIETRGLVPAIEAADAMTKASVVRLICRQFVGGGYVTVMVRGETGTVNTAVRAGADACERVGDGLTAAHIIARPHAEVEQILPESPTLDGCGRDGEVTGIHPDLSFGPKHANVTVHGARGKPGAEEVAFAREATRLARPDEP